MPRRKLSQRQREENKRCRQRELRSSRDYQLEEQARNTAAHAARRSDPNVRAEEQARNTAAHAARRSDPNVRAEEQSRNTGQHAIARSDPNFRAKEQARNTVAHATIRATDPDFRAQEQARDTAAHTTIRATDPDFRAQEQARDTASHATRRATDPDFRAKEQARDTAAHSTKRSSAPDFRAAEQQRNTLAHRVARAPRKRKVSEPKSIEPKRIKKSPYEKLVDDFEKLIWQDQFVCCCCGGLWYIKSPRHKITKEKVKQNYEKWLSGTEEEMGQDEDEENEREEENMDEDNSNQNPQNCSVDIFIDKVFALEQQEYRMCRTCKGAVTGPKPKIPKLCLKNGFEFPTIPFELQDLSPLEERLVSPRLPFAQIRSLGVEGQIGMKGSVVNVENDEDKCVDAIPRKFDDCSTVQIMLKRRMSDKNPYMHETIRPSKVFMAAKYLAEKTLYHDDNRIGLCEQWKYRTYDKPVSFVVDEDDLNRNDGEHIDMMDTEINENEAEVPSASVEFSEAERTEDLYDIMYRGAEESLVYSETDVAVKVIAPGEGKTPVPLFKDDAAEELAFPTIYCGEKRKFPENLNITYTDIVKSELRRYDRRACTPTHVLYQFSKSYMQKARDAVQVYLRKSTDSNQGMCAGNLRKKEFVENLLKEDHGYTVFKNLRSSPAYLEQKNKTARAMIRQQGPCSFFITLSAAETKWPDLLAALWKIHKNEQITAEDTERLTFVQKSELIRSDPVTCMRHFQNRVEALFSKLFKPKEGIFAPYQLEDYFTRTEFQMRGSPHLHGLYWIKNAPTYIENDEESEKQCIQFIDSFITCSRIEEGKMEKLIGYQLHKHSHTCYKKGRLRKCRFGFPKLPFPTTRILKPHPPNVDDEVIDNGRMLFKKIQDFLSERGRHPKDTMSFDDLLQQLDISEEQYIEAARASIKRTTVFYRRNCEEAFINPYNQNLLEAWGANIDFQFTLDAYSCARYCAGYIFKAEGGVSKLLRAAAQDVRGGNLTIREKLKRFARILITGSDICAQEATAFLLGIDYTNCSRTDIFVNTSPPENRTRILKSQKLLEQMDDNDRDVFGKGVIDRYKCRPDELEDICLAEFATMFEFKSSKPGGKTRLPVYQLVGCNGFVQKRGKRKILRFRNFSKTEDPVEFCREQLMLFVPWRDEEKEVLQVNHVQQFQTMETVVDSNSQPYYFNRDIDAILLKLNWVEEDFDREEDENEQEVLTEDLVYLEETLFGKRVEPCCSGFSSYQKQKADYAKPEKFRAPRLVPDEDYYKTMRSLNDKQRKFVLQVLNWMKNFNEPIYPLLHGGAGVGKSLSITAIVQTLIRYFKDVPSTNPDQVCVLVAAFTGKAAFNVYGMTLHTTFRLPPQQHEGIAQKLDESTANSLRSRLAGIKLFIIDEISMVSVQHLYDIDARLRQVYGNNLDFGGRSVMVVGHFRQLPPMGGSRVFSDLPHHNGELCTNYLWEKFRIFELTEIMRQRGALNFCKCLNNMSVGEMDDADKLLMRQCQISVKGQPPDGAIWLFKTNDQCKDHTEAVHEKLQTPGAVAIAKDRIKGTGTTTAKEKLLEFVQKLPHSKTEGLAYEMPLKEKGNYFISTNIDVSDGLFNGATGVLVKIDFEDESSNTLKPVRAWMEFHDTMIGASRRDKFIKEVESVLKTGNDEEKFKARVYLERLKKGWVPIIAIKKTLNTIGRPQGLQVVRFQIPLVFADGMTVAKAQGSTISGVVASVAPYRSKKGRILRLTREELYVICSRAPSEDLLWIDGDFVAPDPPPDDDPVTIELARLEKFPMKFTLRFLQDCDATEFKLYFHNIQYFNAHYLDIQSDLCPMSADVIALVEPHLLTGEPSELSGFQCCYRRDCTTRTQSEGMLIFKKDSAEDIRKGEKTVVLEDKIQSTDGLLHCILVQKQFNEVPVVTMYKSPRYSAGRFMDLLENSLRRQTSNAIFIGDVNINLQLAENARLIELFRKYGFTSKLDINSPTTNAGTHIDICFSNFKIAASIYESYYSHHKPICVTWPRNSMT